MPLKIEYRHQSICFKKVYSPQSRYVNDHCILRGKDHLFHLFHIVGPSGKKCYDPISEITFGHATSKDLLQWKEEPDCLSTDPQSEHEAHHIFAPYVFERGGRYYMFYSGINTKTQAESMCLASSIDLFDWTKHTGNPIFHPGASWAYQRFPCDALRISGRYCLAIGRNNAVRGRRWGSPAMHAGNTPRHVAANR